MNSFRKKHNAERFFVVKGMTREIAGELIKSFEWKFLEKIDVKVELTTKKGIVFKADFETFDDEVVCVSRGIGHSRIIKFENIKQLKVWRAS